jgi:hypothetical protein
VPVESPTKRLSSGNCITARTHRSTDLPNSMISNSSASVMALRQLAAANRPDGVHAYWLLDQSSLPQGKWLKRLVGRAAWVDVLSGESEDVFNGATPILLSASGACATPRFVDALYEAARFANSVSLIDSTLNLIELQVMLCDNARIELPDAFEALLRHFDTRTLPLLPRLLRASQYGSFMQAISRWVYIDRWGQPQLMPAAQPAPMDQASQQLRLVLDEKQEAELIDDGLTDAVIDMLLTQQHPSLKELSPPEQFDAVEPLIQISRTQEMNEPLEAFAFVASALEHGADFNQREPWLSRMRQYRAKQCSLEEVFE